MNRRNKTQQASRIWNRIKRGSPYVQILANWTLNYGYINVLNLKTSKQVAHKINWKGNPLELQHPKFENSRLCLTESVHGRCLKMRHPSRLLALGWVILSFQFNVEPHCPLRTRKCRNNDTTIVYRCTGRRCTTYTRPVRATNRSHSQLLTLGGREKVTQINVCIANKQMHDQHKDQLPLPKARWSKC